MAHMIDGPCDHLVLDAIVIKDQCRLSAILDGETMFVDVTVDDGERKQVIALMSVSPTCKLKVEMLRTRNQIEACLRGKQKLA